MIESETYLSYGTIFVGPLVGRITDTTEAFWNSPYYFPVTLAVTAVSLLTGECGAVYGGTGAAVWVDADVLPGYSGGGDAVSDDLLLSTVKYDSPGGFPTLCASGGAAHWRAAGHFLRWRAPITVGRSGPGLAAVSIATLLGGLGTIPAKEYFSPLSLYYTLGLGLGLLVTYVLLRSDLAAPRLYDMLQRLMQMLYTLGLGHGAGHRLLLHGPLGGICKKLGDPAYSLPELCGHHFSSHSAIGLLHGTAQPAAPDGCAAVGPGALFHRQPHGTSIRLGDDAAGHAVPGAVEKLPLWSFFAVLVTAAVAVLLFGQQIYELFFGCRGYGFHQPP